MTKSKALFSILVFAALFNLAGCNPSTPKAATMKASAPQQLSIVCPAAPNACVVTLNITQTATLPPVCAAPGVIVNNVCTCPAPNTMVNGVCTVPPPPPPPPSGVTVTPLSLTFTSPLNVKSAIQLVTVTNNGTALIPFDDALIGGGFAWGGVGTCNTSGVAAKTSCTDSITYTPVSPAQSSGSLVLKYGTPTVTTTVPLTGGTGIAPPPPPPPAHSVTLNWNASAMQSALKLKYGVARNGDLIRVRENKSSADEKRKLSALTYTVYRSTTKGGPYAPTNSQPITTTSYTDVSVVSPTTYYYIVRASNGAQESVNSNEVQAVVP